MQDKIETIGTSLIQHGTSNNRIYLLKLSPGEDPSIVEKLDKLAAEEGYSKIFTKIRANTLPWFLNHGYAIEAYVPGYFDGKEDCMMVSKFPDPERACPPVEELNRFYDLLLSDIIPNQPPENGGHQFEATRLEEKDSEAITNVFKQVFETYPFPVHDPRYILKTMQTNAARYYGIRERGKLVGVSTAETDLENKNAEMTDFAVLPECRGRNMAGRLLVFMEQEMKKSGIKTAYTIARLKEPGMNKTFLKAGYKYTGTLINNTNIGGSIESMNIFYKKL